MAKVFLLRPAALLLLLLHLLLLLGAASVEAFLFGNPFARPVVQSPKKPDFETTYGGAWKLVTPNVGISAMHLAITSSNQAVMFDSTIAMVPPLKLPPGNCRPVPKSKTNEVDCSVHGVVYDLETNTSRTLKVLTNTWCSSGGFAADGTLVQTGGFKDGARAVRYLRPCDDCDWEEYTESFSGDRWYSTQVTLPDGSFIIVGGRHQFSYEYIPQAGKANRGAFRLQFLVETTDDVENNLYPFVHLSTDGNLFIFANNRAILLNPETNAVVRSYPELEGGARNYPASGMSALLPIQMRTPGDSQPIPAEVIVCGGAARTAFKLAEQDKFLPALQSCGRLVITDPDAKWDMEQMPMPRTVGDMLNLPNGEVLIINGAMKGCAGWLFGRDPALQPVLYRPTLPRDRRFRTLAATNIPRMYHSTCAVLPDASILVSGSNPNTGYKYDNVMYKTEVSVEQFYPPYFDPLLAIHRPEIDESSVAAAAASGLRYRESFSLSFTVADLSVHKTDIKVTMYAPPFTTHGYSMNQRLLVLNIENFQLNGLATYRLEVTAPPSGVVAPPGYYLLFVVNRGVPSTGIWVQIK